MTNCHIAYLCSLFSKLSLLNQLQTHVAAVLASQWTLTMFKGVVALRYVVLITPENKIRILVKLTFTINLLLIKVKNSS